MKLKYVLLTIALVILISGCIDELTRTGKNVGDKAGDAGIEAVKTFNETLNNFSEPQELVDGFCESKEYDTGKIYRLSNSVVCYGSDSKLRFNYGKTQEYSLNEYITWKEVFGTK